MGNMYDNLSTSDNIFIQTQGHFNGAPITVINQSLIQPNIKHPQHLIPALRVLYQPQFLITNGMLPIPKTIASPSLTLPAVAI